VPFWAFYLMKDWPTLHDGLDRRLPAPWAADARVLMGLAGSSFANWIRGQLIASAVAGAFTFVEFEILGMTIDPVFSDVAFVMAAVAFVFELIPTVGPTIALIPYLIVGAAAGVIGMVAVFVGWVVAQQLENAWIVPRVQSRATDLHPAVILTVLVIGGAIHGLLGVILAVPVTSALWRIADYYLPSGDGRQVEGPMADALSSVPAPATSDARIAGRPAVDAA
jgi:predicted PurR-regulated permease PerM